MKLHKLNRPLTGEGVVLETGEKAFIVSSHESIDGVWKVVVNDEYDTFSCQVYWDEVDEVWRET